MMVPQYDEQSTFQSLILPPLYLFDSAGVIVPKEVSMELIAKEPVLLCCTSLLKSSDDSDDVTVCSSSDSSAATSLRNVGFKTGNDGEVLKTEYAGPEEITAEEREAAWYRNSEFKHFRKHAKKLATIAAASKYGKDFQKTCKACAKGEKDLDKYSKLANSSARGLEILVAPQLLKERKGTIRSVLKAQEKLGEESSIEQRAEMLSATSSILSRQTKLLARILAKGDANVAKAVHEESSEEV